MFWESLEKKTGRLKKVDEKFENPSPRENPLSAPATNFLED